MYTSDSPSNWFSALASLLCSAWFHALSSALKRPSSLLCFDESCAIESTTQNKSTNPAVNTARIVFLPPSVRIGLAASEPHVELRFPSLNAVSSFAWRLYVAHSKPGHQQARPSFARPQAL